MIKQPVPVAVLASVLALASAQALSQRLPQDREAADPAAASRGSSSMERRSDAARDERRVARGVVPGPAATPEHPGGLFAEGVMDRSASAGSSAPQRENAAWATEGANRGLPAY
jgi:hypothetical protein